VREVFARVGNGDLRVADLYAEDAVIVHSGGGHVEGRENIRSFYRSTIEEIHPQPTVEAVLESPPLYVAIVNVATSDGRLRALDLFEVDDAGIRRLEIFSGAKSPQ
jgi:hypothetical protein